uniref:RNase H type-1 domain-containing protein n=1 Tax=Cannabis sativa TaxID=3483 RepID=A0A803P6E4_CANSA
MKTAHQCPTREKLANHAPAKIWQVLFLPGSGKSYKICRLRSGQPYSYQDMLCQELARSLHVLANLGDGQPWRWLASIDGGQSLKMEANLWRWRPAFVHIFLAERFGPILASRGIRQGDPLSPYLFTLCAEGFSTLIQKYETNRWIHGCKIARSAPTISHMFFADDSYLYCQASEAEASYFMDLLSKFELASGQKVNVAKSSIFFSTNTDEANGSLVDVLNQPWLMDKDNPYITSTHPALLNAKVSQLMVPNERRWDEDILNDLFSDVDKDLVRGVVISSSCEFDSRYWFFEASGQYSVKSAYKRLQAVNDDETVDHVLVDCSFSRQCWQQFSSLSGSAGVYFVDWFLSMASSFSSSGLGSVAVICWAIWKARNDAKTQSFESDLPTGVITSPRWDPPRLNTIKVNVDASFFASDKRLGIGWLARDHEGWIMYALAVAHQVVVEPVMAEAIGLKEVLNWLKTTDFQQVVVESDCQVLVNAIQNKVTMYSPFGLIVDDCVSLMNDLRSVSLNFVKQSENKAANFLARNACLYSGRSYSRGLVPTELQAIIVADLL